MRGNIMGTKATAPQEDASVKERQVPTLANGKPNVLAREYLRKPSSSSISIMHNAFKGLIASDE